MSRVEALGFLEQMWGTSVLIDIESWDSVDSRVRAGLNKPYLDQRKG